MNEKIEKIKAHIKEHRGVYASVATGVVVAVITTLIMRERESHAKLEAGMGWPEKASVDSLSFLNGKTFLGTVNNTAVTTIHKGSKGNPGFVTRCVETGELFANQGDAARAFDIPEDLLSRHLNHKKELVENLHFERVGVLVA